MAYKRFMKLEKKSEELEAFPATEEHRKAVLNLLEKKLRCTECNQIREPPFNQCPKSHLVCRPCHGSERECSICKSYQLKCRLFIFEELYPFMEVPCVYTGCNFFGPTTEYIEHKKTCIFYQVKCPSPNCNVKFQPDKVFEHFAKEHPQELMQNEEHAKRVTIQYVVDNKRICTNIIQHEGEIYLLTLYITRGIRTIQYLATNFERKFRTDSRKVFHMVFPCWFQNKKRKIRVIFYELTLEEKEAGIGRVLLTNHCVPCEQYFPFELYLRFSTEEFSVDVLLKRSCCRPIV